MEKVTFEDMHMKGFVKEIAPLLAISSMYIQPSLTSFLRHYNKARCRTRFGEQIV